MKAFAALPAILLAATVLTAPAMAAAPAGKAPAQKAALSAADKEFITKAGQGGLAEVMTSKLALQKSKNAQVKTVAQHLISDHTKANATLKSIAQSNGATVPAAPNAMQKSSYNSLSKLTGPKFDQNFLSAEKGAHQSTIDLFKTEAKSGQNAELKKFAANTLPKLEAHLKMVEKTTPAAKTK